MDKHKRDLDRQNFEIIETYWNVNAHGCSQHRTQSSEIIETYWNVNLDGTGQYAKLAAK